MSNDKFEMIEDMEEKMPADKRIAEYLYDWMGAAVVSICSVILLFTFLLGIVGVEGSSMANTLKTGDKLIITHFFYTPAQGDIVVVSRNYKNDGDMAVDDRTQPLIKRVIATAGQKVEIKEDEVYIDGEKINEPYIKNSTPLNDFPPQGRVVPEGHVMVMGDNRQDSHDSRSNDIGMVDTRYILGKAIVRVFPFNQIKTF